MKKIICLSMACCLFLYGCSSLFEREIYDESPYVEYRDDIRDTSDLVAANESELKSALLQLVRSGSLEGVVTLVRYQGDPSRDLLNAVGSVSNEEPIGRYAVYYMTYSLTKALTSYTAVISITYKRSLEQIESIEQTSGRAGLKDSLYRTMLNYEPVLTAEMAYYDPAGHDPVLLAREIGLENPFLEMPEITVSSYPDSGFRRIVEINCEYKAEKSVLLERTERVKEEAEAIILSLRRDLGEFEKFQALYRDLSESAEFVQDNEDGSLGGTYGALINKAADGEGFALALKYLCDLAEIQCMVVFGQKNGEEHIWNLVNIDEKWYHTDITGNYFLKSKADMPEYTYSEDGFPEIEEKSYGIEESEAEEE